MAQANIDHDKARRVLNDAIAAGKAVDYVPRHPKALAISQVMLGSHLTYRYVLFTNLLAKATNGEANGLALQAGADLDGAFDSRSLCHKVVVDFDRAADKLAGKLGRSNEPYLNKPARYAALTTDNAVRRGSDRRTLETCIDILGGLKNSADARTALVDAVHFVMRRETLVAQPAENKGDTRLRATLINFASGAVATSCEGESAPIVAGLALYIIGRGFGRVLDVRIHPVNQAGSSSREILDIDVRTHASGMVVYAAEVKDKVFSYNDVEHAATKAAAAGLPGFFFICGPNSQGSAVGSKFIAQVEDEKHVSVCFVDIGSFFAMAMGFAPPDLTTEEVWAFIDESMGAARVKDGTRTHIIDQARNAGLVASGD